MASIERIVEVLCKLIPVALSVLKYVREGRSRKAEVSPPEDKKP